jgi:two-component system sensor kinase FixL
MLAGQLPASEVRDKIANLLESAAGQVLRAGEIVRRLRDFMSHGRTSHQPENLPRLITEANALALVGTREHGIEVDIELDHEAEQVLADRVQIQQVLVNLIRNGIDAMIGSKKRRLRISSRRAGDFVEISVEDTGSGLDETVAACLFQPFITSKESGMGVGLSICRTIIEAHRGRIWFDSVPTGGTVFHFTLPIVD